MTDILLEFFWSPLPFVLATGLFSLGSWSRISGHIGAKCLRVFAVLLVVVALGVMTYCMNAKLQDGEIRSVAQEQEAEASANNQIQNIGTNAPNSDL